MPDSALNITPASLRSPLHHLTTTTTGKPGQVGLQAAEQPNLGYIVLRGHATDAVFMQGVAAVLGSPLPTRPRAMQVCAAGVILWQSPDEWWLLCARAQRDRLVGELERVLQGCFAQVVDNSGGFTSLRLTGAQHMRLLAHLSPYDFDSLPVGDCVSTVVSKATFTVMRSDTQGVTLVFRRSFADYLWALLDRTARPYGLQVSDASQCADALLQPLLKAGR